MLSNYNIRENVMQNLACIIISYEHIFKEVFVWTLKLKMAMITLMK